jgi:hypothetical protein
VAVRIARSVRTCSSLFTIILLRAGIAHAPNAKLLAIRLREKRTSILFRVRKIKRKRCCGRPTENFVTPPSPMHREHQDDAA